MEKRFLSTNHLKILVVDDEAYVRVATSIVLRSAGYQEILEADSGKTCLRMIEQHDPALVLLDRKMPGMDGIQVLEAIRERFGETPVVVMLTAFSDKDYITEAMRRGAFHYLVKDSDNAAQLQVIEMALRHHERLQLKILSEQHFFREVMEEASSGSGYSFRTFSSNLAEKLKIVFPGVLLTRVFDCVECNLEPNSSDCPVFNLATSGNAANSTQPQFRIFSAALQDDSFQYSVNRLVPPEQRDQVKGMAYIGFAERPDQRLADFLSAGGVSDGVVRYCCCYVFCDNEIDLSYDEKVLLKQGFENLLVAMRMGRLVERLEKQTRYKMLDNMATAVVHQISPLITPLLHNLQECKEENMQESADMVKNLKGILDNFRDYVRGIRQEMHLESFDLIRSLENAQMQVRVQNPDRIRFVNHLAVKTAMLQGNRWALEQVFLNLMTNSAQLNNILGEPIQMEVSVKETGKMWQIVLRDTGNGIPRKSLATLFDESTPSQKTQGLHLGLSLAKYFVESHRGSIKCNPAYAGGAEFIITLPQETMAQSAYVETGA